MATNTLHSDTAAAKPTIGEELRILSKQASDCEEVRRRATAVRDAIDHGRLLNPANSPGDYERHCAASVLLEMLRDEVKRLEEAEGTDVSIALSVRASDAERGMIQRLRYCPE